MPVGGGRPGEVTRACRAAVHYPEPVPRLEVFSKRAAIVMLLAITAMQVALHPDNTWPLRAIATGAFVFGWFAGGRTAPRVMLAWIVAAPLAPALLYQLTGRQGPIADVLWMAGLTGSLLRATSWSQWFLPPLWKPLLGGWALTLSFAWPILLAREADFDIGALRDISVVNSWAMLTADQVMAWTLYAVQVQLLGLLWFDWIHRLFDASERLPRVVHALWAGVTVASAVALLQGAVDIGFLNTSFWIDERRAAGTMLDANAYGFAAALAGPLAYLALRADVRGPVALAIAVLTLNWAGVWMSGSRTALTCALFGAAGLAFGVSRGGRDRRFIAGAALAAAAVVLVASTLTISPIQRALGMLHGGEGLDSLWSRGGYGTVAMEMTRDYPLTGVGTGAYRYLAPDYWRAIADAQLALDNAQNWWRHQIAELGIVGGAPILLWSALLAAQSLAGRTRKGWPAAAWTVRTLVIGVGVVSIFGMPTQNPVALLLFFFLVAWMDRVLTPVPPRAPAPLVRGAWVAAALCAAVHVAGHAALASGPLSVTERSMRFHREYVQGAYAPEPMEGGGHFRWTDDEARLVLPARTSWLVVRLWAHHPDIGERPVEVTLSAPCGVVFHHALGTPRPITIGILLPVGLDTVDATVRVSRTWRPADVGAEDPRTLGAAVATAFVDDPDLVYSQDYSAVWACQEN